MASYKTFPRAAEAMLDKLKEMGPHDESEDYQNESASNPGERKIASWLRRRESLAQLVDPILNEIGKDAEARKLARAFIFETVKYTGKQPTKRDVLKIYAGSLYWLREIKSSEFHEDTLVYWRNLVGEYEDRTLGLD